MIRSLTGRNGVRVSQIGDTWIVVGQSDEIAALREEIAALKARLDALNLAPDLTEQLEDLRHIVLGTQTMNNAALEALDMRVLSLEYPVS